jgi:GTP-binding protein Era
MSPRQPTKPSRAGRVALVGRPNVGKSTLLNAVLGERLAIISPQPQTTRTAVRGVVTRGEAQFVFVDTPGLHAARTRLGRHMNDAARGAASDADVVVLMVEAPREGSPPGPREGDLSLLAELPTKPTVLVINKIDRLTNKERLLPLIAELSGTRPFTAVVPLSAKRADGTDRLLDELEAWIPEQPFLFDPDTLSDQPARFFVAELVREQILRLTRQEVPHGVAVVVEHFDETGPVTQIAVTIHVAREAHKKILIGAKGRMLKEVGSAARIRVEQMLDRKVNLRTHIKATPGWMDDEARLRELGYSGGTEP